MSRKAAFIAALTLAAGSTAAQAALVDASTAEAVSFRYCIAGVTACDAVTAPVLIDWGGSPGAAASVAGDSVAGIGAGAGSVSLSGTIGAPILLANAASDPGARVNTTSLALQSYTYTGAGASTRTFGAALTYSQTLTGFYPGGNGNGIYAAMDLFTLSVPKVDVGSTPDSNFLALAEPELFPGYSDLGYQEYSDTASTAAGSATLGVTVTLLPGETVWVWVLLQTPALNGSVVDASHTLVTSWDNPLNLTPAVVVPEPATGSLMLLGIAGIVLFRRRTARVDGASCSRRS